MRRPCRARRATGLNTTRLVPVWHTALSISTELGLIVLYRSKVPGAFPLQNATVIYAGADSQYAGLDQVNILLTATSPSGNSALQFTSGAAGAISSTSSSSGLVPCEFVPLSNKTLRTYFLLVLFLALRAFGNLSLAWGTKHMPETLAADPMVYIRSMLHPGIAVGVAMLILALLVRLALLSLADLSFILPMTAIGYVLAALLGRVFLHEDVSPQRWLAVALIFGGAMLVSGTPQATTGKIEGTK